MICTALHAFSWLGVFYGALLTRSVAVILVFFALGFLSNNFAAPGWVSWMNDLVPPHLRGRFLGFRNKAIGLPQFFTISLARVQLFLAARKGVQLFAFGILFTLGALARGVCLRPFSKQYEPPMAEVPPQEEFRFHIFLSKLAGTNFGRFGLFIFFMTFSVNLMGPLSSVHLLESLNFDYLRYMGVMMISLVFSFVAMNYWGPLTDRYGNYRILTATAIALPLLPMGWVFFKSVSLLMVVQMFSGFVWAGFNLSMTNYIYDAVRRGVLRLSRGRLPYASDIQVRHPQLRSWKLRAYIRPFRFYEDYNHYRFYPGF